MWVLKGDGNFPGSVFSLRGRLQIRILRPMAASDSGLSP